MIHHALQITRAAVSILLLLLPGPVRLNLRAHGRVFVAGVLVSFRQHIGNRGLRINALNGGNVGKRCRFDILPMGGFRLVGGEGIELSPDSGLASINGGLRLLLLGLLALRQFRGELLNLRCKRLDRRVEILIGLLLAVGLRDLNSGALGGRHIGQRFGIDLVRFHEPKHRVHGIAAQVLVSIHKPLRIFEAMQSVIFGAIEKRFHPI